jgi:hypothetical protein
MKVYITFGQVHVHSVNGKTFDKDSVAVIECDNYSEGRAKAFEYFKGIFHNCYDEKEVEKMERFIEYFPRGYINVENRKEKK